MPGSCSGPAARSITTTHRFFPVAPLAARRLLPPAGGVMLREGRREGGKEGGSQEPPAGAAERDGPEEGRNGAGRCSAACAAVPAAGGAARRRGAAGGSLRRRWKTWGRRGGGDPPAGSRLARGRGWHGNPPPHRGRGGREVGASPILPVEGGKGGSDTPARTLLQKMGFRERQQGRMCEMVCFLRVAADPVATRGPRHPCSLLSSRSVCPGHFSKTVRSCVRSACRDRKLMYRGGKKYSGCRGGSQAGLTFRSAKIPGYENSEASE